MGVYSVIFKPSVEKDFKKISAATAKRIFDHIERLTANPFPRQSIKLTGGEAFYRIRVGEYRVIYEVDTQKKHIIIQYVRHRREVYRDF